MQVDVTKVSRHGIWLLCRDREMFLSFKDFPWFKDAPVASLFHVEEPSPNHFYWPDLDVDLSLRTIEDPQRFPLVANSGKQPTEVREERAEYGVNVQTTLDIDADVLAATNEIAKRQRKSAGKLASELMREALQLRAERTSPKASGRHGFRPIPSGGARLVPVAADDEERARQAASRIRNRRRRLQGAPLAELVATIHEGHRH